MESISINNPKERRRDDTISRFTCVAELMHKTLFLLLTYTKKAAHVSMHTTKLQMGEGGDCTMSTTTSSFSRVMDADCSRAIFWISSLMFFSRDSICFCVLVSTFSWSS